MISLSSFEGIILITYMFGDNSEEVTPVPIPNTEVKLFSADGNWGLSPCESRTLPDILCYEDFIFVSIDY